MHFLDAWSSLPVADLLRLLAAPGCLLLAVVIPGRGMARAAAIGVAAALPYLPELALPAPLRAGWLVLWLAIAWLAGRGGAVARPGRASRFGGMESGTVGLLAGGALLAVLLAALARQGLSPDAARRAALGIALVGLGLVLLMVRRHTRRAVVAFGAFGLGLELIESLARAGELSPEPVGPLVLFATATAVTLTARLAADREALAGSAWVSDAHDLHD